MPNQSCRRTFALLVCLSAGVGAAAAPEKCSLIAERYSKDATKVSDTELADLRTCISDTLRFRQESQSIAPKKTMPVANMPNPQVKKKNEVIGMLGVTQDAG